MKFTQLAPACVLALTSLVTATAVPKPAPEASPEESAANVLTKRDNWAQCTISNCFGNDPNGNGFVRVDTWGAWDDDWGHGFLDNLRGQCGGGIYDWQFWYDNGDTTAGGHASFYAYEGNICKTNAGCPNYGVCSAGCVENALWLASNPTGAIWGVTCNIA